MTASFPPRSLDQGRISSQRGDGSLHRVQPQESFLTVVHDIRAHEMQLPFFVCGVLHDESDVTLLASKQKCRSVFQSDIHHATVRGANTPPQEKTERSTMPSIEPKAALPLSAITIRQPTKPPEPHHTVTTKSLRLKEITETSVHRVTLGHHPPGGLSGDAHRCWVNLRRGHASDDVISERRPC